MKLKGLLKRTTGLAFQRAFDDLAYKNCVFLMAHMRCGSTALSNIICSRQDTNGYGETHVRYAGDAALGRLALNQFRHKSWDRKAKVSFDKILHTRLHKEVPHAFFDARAIFIVREPAATIRSICSLYEKIGRPEYKAPEDAAAYYVERLQVLARTWDNFPAERRFGMTHQGLLQDPDKVLTLLTRHFAFDPPLANKYQSKAASRIKGGGDPLVSGKFDRIEPTLLKPAAPIETLNLPKGLAQAAEEQFLLLRERFAKEWPETVV